MADLDNLTAEQQKQLAAFSKMIEGMINTQKLENSKVKNGGQTPVKSVRPVRPGEKPINNSAFSAKQQQDLANLEAIISQNIEASNRRATAEEPRTDYNVSTSGSTAMDDFMATAMSNYAKQNEFNLEKERQNKIAREKANIKFLTTTRLSKTEYEQETYDFYYNKFIKANSLQDNFELDERDRKYTRGLYTFVYVMGNLHWLTSNNKISNAEAVMQHFNATQFGYIQAGKKGDEPKVALGLMQAYRDSRIGYDEIPDEDTINHWINEYMNIIATAGITTGDIDVDAPFYDGETENVTGAENTENTYTRDDFIPMQDNFPDQPCYQTAKNGGVPLFDARSTQNVLVLNKGAFGEVNTPKYHTIERFKKKLFESRNGAAYEFKKRWELVLKAVRHIFPNAAMVKSFSILGNQLTVNGQLILLDEILGGEYDIRIEDVLSIRDTFKRFPMIQQLVLDNNAAQKLILEYGEDARGIWRLFQEHKPLKYLGIVPSGNGQPKFYNREGFADVADQLDKALAEEKYRMQFEQATAQLNPRLSEKSPGYVNRVWQGGKKFGGKAWDQAKRNFFSDKSPKLMRFMGWSAVSVLCIGVGAVLGVPGAIKSVFKKIR